MSTKEFIDHSVGWFLAIAIFILLVSTLSSPLLCLYWHVRRDSLVVSLFAVGTFLNYLIPWNAITKQANETINQSYHGISCVPPRGDSGNWTKCHFVQSKRNTKTPFKLWFKLNFIVSCWHFMRLRRYGCEFNGSASFSSGWVLAASCHVLGSLILISFVPCTGVVTKQPGYTPPPRFSKLMVVTTNWFY